MNNLNQLFATEVEYQYWLSLIDSLSVTNNGKESTLLVEISNSLYSIVKRKKIDMVTLAGQIGSGKTQIAALFQFLQPNKFEIVTLDKLRHDFNSYGKPWVLREPFEIQKLFIQTITRIKSEGKIPVVDSVILSENDRWFIDMINKPSTLLFRLRAVPHHILIPNAVLRHTLRIKEGHVYGSIESENSQDLINILRIALSGNAIMNTVNTVFNKVTGYTLYLNDGKSVPQTIKQQLVDIGKEHRNDVLTQYQLIEPIVKDYQIYAFSNICTQLLQRLDEYSHKE